METGTARTGWLQRGLVLELRCSRLWSNSRVIAPFLSARGSSDVWIAGGGRWPGDPEASRPSPVACRRAVTALICDVLLSDMCYGRAARQTCALYTLIHTQHFTSSRLRLALGSTDSGLGHRCSSRANVSDRVRGSAHLLVKRVAHRIDSRRIDKDVLFVDAVSMWCPAIWAQLPSTLYPLLHMRCMPDQESINTG